MITWVSTAPFFGKNMKTRHDRGSALFSRRQLPHALNQFVDDYCGGSVAKAFEVRPRAMALALRRANVELVSQALLRTKGVITLRVAGRDLWFRISSSSACWCLFNAGGVIAVRAFPTTDQAIEDAVWSGGVYLTLRDRLGQFSARPGFRIPPEHAVDLNIIAA